MAISISVTGDAVLGYVITVTDADQSVYLRVYRIDLTGHYPDSGVREVDMVVPSDSTMLVIDNEAPFNTDVRYVAEAYDADEALVASAESDIVGTTLPLGFALISDPLENSQRVACAVEDLSKWSYDSRELGRAWVIGSANPIINSDVQSGRSGSMVVSNLNAFAVDYDHTGPYLPYTVVPQNAWTTMFQPGRVLLFRNTWSESGFDDLYFKVDGSVSVSRPTKLMANQPVFLKYDIPFIEQNRPSTALIGSDLNTWDVVDENNLTWDEVDADHADWNSVFTNPWM